eukprot:475358_1
MNARYLDIYNSHAIVTKDYKYIYRATDEVWKSYLPTYPYNSPSDLYPYIINNKEQIYTLLIDPTEQINKINRPGLSDTIMPFRAKMINYIENIACIGTNINRCVVPTIEDDDIPGYTCKKEVIYGQIWDVTGNNYNETEKLNEAETVILSSTNVDYSIRCRGLTDFSNKEYVYMFENQDQKN